MALDGVQEAVKGMSITAAAKTKRSKKRPGEKWAGKEGGEEQEEEKTVKSKTKKKIREEGYLLVGDKCNGNGWDHFDIVWHQTLQHSNYTHSSSYPSQQKWTRFSVLPVCVEAYAHSDLTVLTRYHICRSKDEQHSTCCPFCVEAMHTLILLHEPDSYMGSRQAHSKCRVQTSPPLP